MSSAHNYGTFPISKRMLRVPVPVEPGIVVRVHDRLLILELLLSIRVEHVQFVKVDRVEGIMLCGVPKNKRISTCNFRHPDLNFSILGLLRILR
jgi:hypothetical protein